MKVEPSLSNSMGLLVVVISCIGLVIGSNCPCPCPEQLPFGPSAGDESPGPSSSLIITVNSTYINRAFMNDETFEMFYFGAMRAEAPFTHGVVVHQTPNSLTQTCGANDNALFARVTTDAALLKQLDAIINCQDCGDFAGTEAIIATWINITDPCTETEGKTMQAVMVTDGMGRTFLLSKFQNLPDNQAAWIFDDQLGDVEFNHPLDSSLNQEILNASHCCPGFYVREVSRVFGTEKELFGDLCAYPGIGGANCTGGTFCPEPEPDCELGCEICNARSVEQCEETKQFQSLESVQCTEPEQQDLVCLTSFKIKYGTIKRVRKEIVSRTKCIELRAKGKGECAADTCGKGDDFCHECTEPTCNSEENVP